jgi:hypothetical protein
VFSYECENKGFAGEGSWKLLKTQGDSKEVVEVRK